MSEVMIPVLFVVITIVFILIMRFAITSMPSSKRLSENVYIDDMEGEIITIKATIVKSRTSVKKTMCTLYVTVKYVINNKEFENKIIKVINPISLGLFQIGKTVSIDVDNNDFNHISFNTRWIYKYNAMTEDEYNLRKNNNLL